ncbi:hypothetical protein D9613_011236 [Agrocybe pediades]|uniref:Uncharacterized protein n=1 Tax=Agrocybe pediades TaxID=84607 RepID=A0A8H4VNG7_9AGAR|nr:hypothetical protein D9613_011236 [Agrocybe pediades]
MSHSSIRSFMLTLNTLLQAPRPPSKDDHDKTCATSTYNVSLPYTEKRRKELGRSVMTKTFFLLYTNEHPQGGCALDVYMRVGVHVDG